MLYRFLLSQAAKSVKLTDVKHQGAALLLETRYVHLNAQREASLRGAREHLYFKTVKSRRALALTITFKVRKYRKAGSF